MRTTRNRKPTPGRRPWIAAALLAVSLVLMALPWGVAMAFAAGPGETAVRRCSYFSALPIGYGNWLPLLTALLAGAALVLTAVRLKRPSVRGARACLCLAVPASLLSWAMFGACTVPGAAICLLHAAALALVWRP